MTTDTAYMLLTCAREQTRYDVLAKVIENLKEHPQFENFNQNLIVFDNASTFSNTTSLLRDTFQHVVLADNNYGYWSAINWFINDHESILQKRHKFMYLIESDQIHYDWYKLDEAERFLEDHAPVYDSVRVREFIVAESHLYDKNRPTRDSKRWAWTRLTNSIENDRPVTFELIDPKFKIYRTNFVTLPPSLNTFSLMKHAFSTLSTLSTFTEIDFQRACYEFNPVTCLIDGGICHARLGSTAMSSHNTRQDTFTSNGYLVCSYASMQPLKEMKVTLAK